MTLTLPDDKKDFVKKEVKAVSEKLEVVGRFKEKVDKMEEFVSSLDNFDKTLKVIDTWMKEADAQPDKMTPEDRVSCTMELQEDVAEKVRIIQDAIKTESDLLPQGDDVPKDAKDYKDELKRIETYVIDLQKRVMTTCEQFSEDVKYWAEYKTGIREFRPWLESSEGKTKE